MFLECFVLFARYLHLFYIDTALKGLRCDAMRLGGVYKIQGEYSVLDRDLKYSKNLLRNHETTYGIQNS